MAPTTTISSLPPELHLLIASYLPPRSKFALKHTTHHFHTVLPRLTHTELLQIEQTLPHKIKARYQRYAINTWRNIYDCTRNPVPDEYIAFDHLACKRCLRLRPTADFSDAMRGQLLDSPAPEARCCLECGFRYGIEGHRPGERSAYDYRDMPRVVCLGCVEFPTDEGADWRRMLGECRGCYGLHRNVLDEEVVRRIGGRCLALHHAQSCTKCRVPFFGCGA